jgi:glycosyltransferase involved in cell wall biosynthesis
MARRVAVGVICDFVEENWPSMDLVAEMLLRCAAQDHAGSIGAVRLCPPMVRRFSGFSFAERSRTAFNADRLVNRFWRYPRWLRGKVKDFGLFHVVDQSYSQLLHELPPQRTLVTCHDLETFRCILEPDSCARSPIHRMMARRTLSGFQKAAFVACDSEATRAELLSYQLISPARVTVVANGVHPACSPEPDPAADREAERLLGPPGRAADLLNVGSVIGRKRIDVLLQVFAEVRRQTPGARLIRVGGDFNADQASLIDRLQIRDAVLVLPFLSRPVLAAVYRRAALVVQTSAYEGFGLPVAEAMACGTVVVATDMPVFREVGGDAAVYCPKSDLPAWSETIVGLLRERRDDFEEWQQRRQAGVTRAGAFTWNNYAAQIVALYRLILNP